MITEAARTWVKNQLKSLSNPTGYLYMGIGSGGDSTNPNATSLDAPLGSRVSVTPTESSVATLDWTYIFDGANYVGETIKEVGIFNAASAGDMLIRVNMDGIGPIVASDTIEITVTVEVD